MRLPETIRKYLVRRAINVIGSRPRDFAPGPSKAPFLERWWLLPPSSRGNLWLHCFWESDQDDVPHDHSFNSISLILTEGYWEQTREGKVWRSSGSIIFRKATEPHRVIIPGRRHPVLTIFITGKTFRQWGFVTALGWLSAKDAEARPAYARNLGINFWKNPEAEKKAKP